MENFTIHIFGYGETQINSKELSLKVKTTDLTKVQPLVDAIWSKKPQDSNAEQTFHAINLFGFNDVRYMSKDGFDVKEFVFIGFLTAGGFSLFRTQKQNENTSSNE